MKKFIAVATAVAAFGLVNAASAADMPVKAPMAPVAVAYNWTGFYVGINGGFGTGRTTGDILPTFFGGNFDINGGLFGAQIGYNYQMSNLVLGVEADWDWADISGSQTLGGTTTTAKLKSLGTARGRIGYAWDRVLLYGTGGWAWSNASATCSTCAATSDSHNLNGYALGGGLEYGITQNLSVKAEYLYAHLSPVAFFNNAGCTVNCSAGANVNTFRLGANWRFAGI